MQTKTLTKEKQVTAFQQQSTNDGLNTMSQSHGMTAFGTYGYSRSPLQRQADDNLPQTINPGLQRHLSKLNGVKLSNTQGSTSNLLVQRMVDDSDKAVIGHLSRPEVLARMRNPPKQEKPGEIATVWLEAQGMAKGAEENAAWISLIRDAGLLEDDDDEDALEQDDITSSGGDSGDDEPPTLTDLAKRQLSAAVDTHNAKGAGTTLQAPTMGVGRFSVSDDGGETASTHVKTSNQRNLPGTGEQARQDELEVLPAVTGTFPNMHAEMRGTHHAIEETLAGRPTRLEEMGASQEICFLCELVMTLLGIDYDHAHISKIIYPKWEDPTGKFRDAEGRLLSLKNLLPKLGIKLKDAKARLLARLKREMSADQAEAFAERILNGELQAGKERQKLLENLKAVESIKKANSSRGGGGSTRTRAPSSSTKAGRRIKRELDKARKLAKASAASEELDHDAEEDDDHGEAEVIQVRSWDDARLQSFHAGQRITITHSYPQLLGRIFEFTHDWDGDPTQEISHYVKWINQ